MKKSALLVVALVVAAIAIGGIHDAAAVLPSGNGKTVKAQSVSMTIASDEGAIPVSGTVTATIDIGMLTMPKQTTAVTPSDSTDTTAYCNKGIWVGVAGDVAVKMLSDSVATTIKNVSAGVPVYGQFLRIMSTNTTATNIVCFGGTG